MKKLISTLTAITMITAALPVMAYAEESENPDLKALASSLGSDTDYFNIPYVKATVVNPDGKTEYTDTSMSISALEMLIHNGTISLNSIQSESEKMVEITDSSKVYNAVQNHSQDFVDGIIYSYLFKLDRTKNRMSEIIELAENSEKNGKYFLLMYRGLSDDYTPDMSGEYEKYLSSHTVVGIGITEGKWFFNDKEYDKCILTLDSSNVSENTNAFSENTCIFINSETFDYCIPKYSASSENDLKIIAVNEDVFLNGDTSDIYRIKAASLNNKIYTITTEKSGIETVRNADNEYLDYCHGQYNGDWVVKADRIKIECANYDNINSLYFFTGSTTVETELSVENSIFEYDGKTYYIHGGISKSGNDDFQYNDGEKKYAFYGNLAEGFCFEPTENGIILDSDNRDMSLKCIYNDLFNVNIIISEKTKVEFSENDITGFFIDKDNDGTYEEKIEIGDVNCNGTIDAADSSLILESYASLSVGKETKLFNGLADFNGDGRVDASDASGVLAVYAERATS